MTALLKSVAISNFRSVRGAVTIPLGAPVVLIYGQNGSGKTSVLSAIELGLTGEVASLRRGDPEYVSHLVHKEAQDSRIMVTVDGLNSGPGISEMVVADSHISGKPLFSGGRARHYSERCYLAQATLSRLLELYQNRDIRQNDSPLTQFVKDLLGLDQLDALIDGVHVAGDVRRVRRDVSSYGFVSESIPAIENDIAHERSAVVHLDSAIRAIEDRLTHQLQELGVRSRSEVPGTDLAEIVDTRPDDVALRSLAQLRLEIERTQDSWRALQGAANRAGRVMAAGTARDAHAALDVWRSSSGTRLQGLFAQLRDYVPDLPSLESVGPERASAAAIQALGVEVERCGALLARDDAYRANIIAFDRDIIELRDRATSLDGEIVGRAAGAGELAELLTRIREHIRSNDCPVCERDFGEYSTEKLESYVSKRIGALTASAAQLQALAGERTQVMARLAEVERQRVGTAPLQTTATARDDLAARRARLQELWKELAELAPTITAGEQLLSTATTATRQVNDIQSQDERVAAILETASRIAHELDLPSVGGSEELESTLSRFLADVTERQSVVSNRKVTRRAALEDLQERQGLLSRRAAITKAIGEKEQRAERLRESKKEADELIEETRELVRRVRQTRADIVRRVFNESLNAVWQELFGRLAPDEPFVPAFALPDVQTGPVEAVLETLYQWGGRGGRPQTMLSSGNLNAAALTLFIALHLTVKPTLPWLVIDDPVQSMDEIRIAQFAALLRTLSKQHGRQVIVAVQEKPLFDYLTLELNPAFRDDELYTVEIGRTPGGNTEVSCRQLTWKPDRAVAA